MKKTKQLRELISSSSLQFLMEAHSGISARIVEEAGFKGIWGSGLSISASLGVRDNNEASWTQVLEMAEFMSDATTIPLLLDGDTGYGNFNNVMRLVRKLEQRNIAGVCIEDKFFPKANSFLHGENQPLASVEEFTGKLKAAKDARTDEDFVVVARVEALIAGWGMGEALQRAEAYRKSGADAILIHSKKSDGTEIEKFMKEWANRHPVVIVPTKYYSVPTDHFRKLGVSCIIWANHNLRSSILAMQKTSRQIKKEETLIRLEDDIVPVAEVFRLQGDEDLQEAERRYLPTSGKSVNAIILAAAQGERLGELTQIRPKAMLPVQGKPILEHQVESYNSVGIKDITVVRGFAKDTVTMANIETIDNDQFRETTELGSLYRARGALKKNTVISYGDIIFKRYVLHELLNDDADITAIVDADFSTGDDHFDYVQTDRLYSPETFFQPVALQQMDPGLKNDKIHGEFIGLWKVSGKGMTVLQETLESMAQQSDFATLRLYHLFNELLKKTSVSVKFIKGSWVDIDSLISLQDATDL